MAIAGIDSQPFLVSEVRGRESSVGAEIAAQLPGGPRPEDLILVLPDPRLDTGALVRGIDSSLAPAQIVGAGAADPILGSPLQWLGAEAESEAVAGVALRGSDVRVGVTQACRPSTELMTITQVQGNWIIELDGRPALDVFRDAARGRLAEDLQRAAAFVLIALPCDDEAPLAPGNYLVRHVVGISPENGAFALPDQMSRGQKIALAVREPEAARLDLKAMLAGLEGGSPALGLYFNCCARGSSFFGMEGMEAAYLEHSFRKTPIVGMFGSCEIGPIGGTNQRNAELLTYTGVLALLQG
jgi:small ligand-binding sensory domain FIST